MIGIDTNVVLRWLIDDPDDTDAAQVEAAAELFGRDDETFMINNIVLAETVWVLWRTLRQSREIAAGAVDRLLLTDGVVTEGADNVKRAIDAFRAGEADFADQLIGEVNRSIGCSTTFTFDKAASKLPLFTRLA